MSEPRLSRGANSHLIGVAKVRDERGTEDPGTWTDQHFLWSPHPDWKLRCALDYGILVLTVGVLVSSPLWQDGHDLRRGRRTSKYAISMGILMPLFTLGMWCLFPVQAAQGMLSCYMFALGHICFELVRLCEVARRTRRRNLYGRPNDNDFLYDPLCEMSYHCECCEVAVCCGYKGCGNYWLREDYCPGSDSDSDSSWDEVTASQHVHHHHGKHHVVGGLRELNCFTDGRGGGICSCWGNLFSCCCAESSREPDADGSDDDTEPLIAPAQEGEPQENSTRASHVTSTDGDERSSAAAEPLGAGASICDEEPHPLSAAPEDISGVPTERDAASSSGADASTALAISFYSELENEEKKDEQSDEECAEGAGEAESGRQDEADSERNPDDDGSVDLRNWPQTHREKPRVRMTWREHRRVRGSIWVSNMGLRLVLVILFSAVILLDITIAIMFLGAPFDVMWPEKFWDPVEEMKASGRVAPSSSSSSSSSSSFVQVVSGAQSSGATRLASALASATTNTTGTEVRNSITGSTILATEDPRIGSVMMDLGLTEEYRRADTGGGDELHQRQQKRQEERAAKAHNFRIQRIILALIALLFGGFAGWILLDSATCGDDRKIRYLPPALLAEIMEKT